VSKIRLTPNASGTGTVTLTVPSTSTDRTITLPDATTTLSANMPLGYDMWYLTADDTTVGTHQIDGWTRNTTTDVTRIGGAMSESNSFWTFPSTGYWLIRFFPYFDLASGDQVQTYFRMTKDDSVTTFDVANMNAGPSQGDGQKASEYLFDVENTSTHKLRFIAASIDAAAGSRLFGGSAFRTYAIFMKMGET
jgi:hypothetical protein